LPSDVGYGMTESTGAVTILRKGSKNYDSVGGPIPNTEMKVVNPETRRSLAARQTGEICLRGPQVGERRRRFQFLPNSIYIVLVMLFCVTAVVATSCRLTHLISVALPTAHMLANFRR